MFFTVETKGFYIWAIFRISSLPQFFMSHVTELEFCQENVAAPRSFYFISFHFPFVELSSDRQAREKKRVNLIQFQITFEMEPERVTSSVESCRWQRRQS